MNAFGAYSVVALVGALASFLLGFGTIRTLSHISDSGMWAIAVMTLAPALMAIGVSLFICLSHRANPPRDPDRRRPPDDPYESGAFIGKER
jgi:hypothetical protein